MTDRLLHESFELNVKRSPESVAIVTSSQKISYKQLNDTSNFYAEKLIGQQLKPNKLVAIIMKKGWEQVVAVLSVLKAGAAYLPIDPNESKERLEYLLSTGEVNVILTQERIYSSLTWLKSRHIISVDETFKVPQTILDLNNYKSKETDLAYVIFTSGSTGTPKGVMITHQSVVNTIMDINERFSVSSKDKVLAISDLTFDLSVYDIFGTLAAGGTIVMMDPCNTKDPTRWESLVFNEGVTVWNSVPVLMDMFVEFLKNHPPISKHSLRLVLLSGDWISLNLPQKIRSIFGNIEIVSLGGATEASIWSILYPIRSIDPNWKSIPYGLAMKNQSFYILDQNLGLVTGDQKGELYIGGIGVAKGYWRDSERTSAQFIFHPIYGRLYKTGDVGRYLLDGNIEFLGRVDFQVKISGYRIEVGAIEKYLLECPDVNQAIVTPVQEQRHQKLVAYLTLNQKTILAGNNYFLDLERTQVDYWQKIYDELNQPKTILNNNDPTFNTVGWISSYLNKPIPKIQMQEWVDNTVKRISELKSKTILEIGSGTGLLLFRLAQQTIHYHAVDFSQPSLQYLEKYLKELNINNVELFKYEAKDVNLIPYSYDSIILNSVAQYFPSIDYFIDVLEKCISKVNTKGYIFIGDLRSLPHLKAFHASVLLNHCPKNTSFQDWLKLLERSIEEEDELVVDCELFYRLKELNKKISYVRVLLKEGKFNNEMNNFRYDVILYIDHPTLDTHVKSLQWKDWRLDNFTTEQVHASLVKEETDYLAIKNVPNRRVAGFNTITYMAALFNVKNWLDVCKNVVAEERSKSIDPEIFFEQAYNHNYDVTIRWSNDNLLDCFDVIFKKKSLMYNYFSLLQNDSVEYRIFKDYANLPLLPRLQKKCIINIKHFLKTRLPSYMIPSYFIVLKEFPLNSNGKIDRKSLPKLGYLLEKETYASPRTGVEKKLAKIWKRILGINKVGIRDTFYDLGGTSLLAVQLIIDIHKILGIRLSVQEIAVVPTIEKLGELLGQRLKRARERSISMTG